MLDKEKKMMELKLKWSNNNFKEYVYNTHSSLTSDMRAILLDWMCQVSSDYNLKR